MRVFMRVTMVMIVPFMIVIGRRGGQAGRLIGERKQRIAFGAGKPATVLFAGKQPDEKAGQQQTEEEGDWYDGHAWECLDGVSAKSRPVTAHGLPYLSRILHN